MIVKSVNHDWIDEVESKMMGFTHLSPKALLTHLWQVAGCLDHMDVMELISNIHKPWDGIETPASHFAWGDKYEHTLLKVVQAWNPQLWLAFALATFQSTGEFNSPLCGQENLILRSADGRQSLKQIEHLQTSVCSCKRSMANITSKTSPQQNP